MSDKDTFTITDIIGTDLTILSERELWDHFKRTTGSPVKAETEFRRLMIDDRHWSSSEVAKLVKEFKSQPAVTSIRFENENGA